MGAVYEAVDQRLDTVVALKETLFTDERLRKQFEREARLLARLHHQALPRVSDHFTEGEGQFLVMQFIPGEDLFEMQTRRKGAFGTEEVLRWADQLCDALDYLHTQDPQIIHRDIKPQNLKLTGRGQIILLDFGLAKGSGGQMSVVTTSASIFGYTPNYAPLEQVQGLGTDPRSDIYSLAATLYHLLTNVKPPDALSRAAAMVNGLPDPLAPADTVASHVSQSIAAVLDKGMSQKRDDRYDSALDMRSAFQSAAAHPVAEAATVLTSAGPATHANTVSPSAGTRVAAAPTSAGGNEAQTLLADDPTKVRTQVTAVAAHPALSRPTSRLWLAAALVLLAVAGIFAGGLYLYRTRQSDAAANAPATAPSPAAVTESTPAASNGSSQAAALEPTGTPKAEAATQSTKSERVTQTSKPAAAERRPTPQPQNPDPAREQRDTLFDRNPQDRPRVPEPRDPPPVRTFPNGTRVDTRPDGTTIVTFPDGRTRVFPPGARPNRRRRIPN